jgi:hypothetical protein
MEKKSSPSARHADNIPPFALITDISVVIRQLFRNAPASDVLNNMSFDPLFQSEDATPEVRLPSISDHHQNQP